MLYQSACHQRLRRADRIARNECGERARHSVWAGDLQLPRFLPEKRSQGVKDLFGARIQQKNGGGRGAALNDETDDEGRRAREDNGVVWLSGGSVR